MWPFSKTRAGSARRPSIGSCFMRTGTSIQELFRHLFRDVPVAANRAKIRASIGAGPDVPVFRLVDCVADEDGAARRALGPDELDDLAIPGRDVDQLERPGHRFAVRVVKR